MQEITETMLPGVGVRHEFTTSAGERLSLLTHRTGRRELAVYDRGDPDACRTVFHLSPGDVTILGDLLGVANVSETVHAVQQLEGVVIDWITVSPKSGFAGTSILDGQFRTTTGVSIVAVVHGGETIPAPDPTTRLDAGDTVVGVGTAEGLRNLRALLES